MRFFAKTIILCIAQVSLSFGSVMAEEQPVPVFDTKGFVSECTSFVPDVAYAPVMDGECISQTIKLCHLSLDLKGWDHCVHEVTDWMMTEIDRFNSTDPDAGLAALEEFGTFDFDLSLISAILPDEMANFDCNQMQDVGVSPDTLCKYAEALEGWHKSRIVSRSSARDATDDGGTQ